MRKLFAVLLATVVFVPVSAMAQYKPNQKPNKPSYNGPVTHPGSNHGGIHSQPGHGTPNHGNNNNSGYNNGNSNNHGNSNHGNNGGYNNGNSNHGHPGYNPGNNNNHGHPGYNPGNNHGHPGHPPVMIPELPQAHRAVTRAFRTVENSYFPIFMSKEDRMKMGRAIGMLSRELESMVRYVGPRHRDEIRNVARIVENAKFTMFSENDVRGAYRKIQRAEGLYNRIADDIFRR